MCRTCGKRHNSLETEDDGTSSPGSVQDGSAESLSNAVPFIVRSPGKVSPIRRGRTMKECEDQLDHLKKENFQLKLRIYFYEEQIDKNYNPNDKDKLYHTNIELKVENEALKKELYDKQELVRQASSALAGIEKDYSNQTEQLKEKYEEDISVLEAKIRQLQKEIDFTRNDHYSSDIELSQLCGLAFAAADDDEPNLASSFSTSSNASSNSYPTSTPTSILPSKPFPTSVEQNKSCSANIASLDDSHSGTFKPLTFASPITGLFSMPSHPEFDNPMANAFADLASSDSSQDKVSQLEAEIRHLKNKIQELQEELSSKAHVSEMLNTDVTNLKKEIEEKVEKIFDLEAEVAEKDQKVDQLMQDLEIRHIEIQDQESKIQTLNEEINKVEPEIEVKVQEIVERDRIIEEKIEQIQQQNKILVEIQITLDEKQKQITELENNLHKSQEKVQTLSEESHARTLQLQTSAKEVESKEKEIKGLKKEVKRLEKRVKDLVAELKEAVDMMKKFKWQAETSGTEDGVKEMVEDENERLWAELEQRKSELLSLRTENETALKDAKQKTETLQEVVNTTTNEVKMLQLQNDLSESKLKEEQSKLRDKSNEIEQLEKQVACLRGDATSREGALQCNEGIVATLQNELSLTKDLLKSKNEELNNLYKQMQMKNFEVQNVSNKDLVNTGKEIDDIQNKLKIMNLNNIDEIEDLKRQLCTKNQLLQLQMQSLSGLQVQNSGPISTSYNNEPSNNVINFTQINGNQPTNENTVNNIGNNDVQYLYKEVEKIKSEALALKKERASLKNILTGLQNVHKKVCIETSIENSNEIEDQMEHLKKQLEETKEENLQNNKKYEEVVNNFQSQIEKLKSELYNAKNKITQQISDVTLRRYKEIVRKHRNEEKTLRSAWAESQKTCSSLKIRLDDLTDFLEQILEMDQNGATRLNELMDNNRNALHRSLNESRVLSQSLSQPILKDFALTGKDDEDKAGSSNSSSVSIIIQKDDSLSEIPEINIASSQEDLSPMVVEQSSTNNTFRCTSCLDVALPDFEYQIITDKLSCEIKLKEDEINGIADKVSNMNTLLKDREEQIQKHSDEISLLNNEISKLREQVQIKNAQLDTTCISNNIDDKLKHDVVQLKQQLDQNNSSSSSSQLPVESESSSQPSDNSTLRSAYSTDVAIKANSNNPEYFEKLSTPLDSITKCENVEINQAAPKWKLLSPSESEAWSEPDRNVSLARIGLNTNVLGASLERSVSRSRQIRNSVVLSSESEGEALAEEGVNINISLNGNKTIKRKQESGEIRRLCTKLKNVEQINETLKAELNIYQALSQQMPQKKPLKFILSSKNTDFNNEASLDNVDTSIVVPEDINFVPILPTPLLDEIRALRVKLEEAIANNDLLRDQLENAISAHPNEDPYYHQLSVALQATTDQLQFTQEKLGTALKSEQESSTQINQLKQTLAKQTNKHQQLLDEGQTFTEEHCKIQNELEKCHKLVNEKDILLNEKSKALQSADDVRQECETKLRDQDKAITDLCNNLTRLQKENQSSNDHNKRLQETIQNSETKMLQLTKERLFLVSENTRINAQLTHMINENKTLIYELEKCQNSASDLIYVNDKKSSSSHSDDFENRNSDSSLINFEHNCIYKNEFKRLQLDNLGYRTENDELNNKICRLRDSELRSNKIAAQLDTERRLTSNLQLQLDNIQSTQFQTSPKPDNFQETSDLASPASAASFEFFNAHAGDFCRKSRASSFSSSKDCQDFINRKPKDFKNGYWSDNKENLEQASSTFKSNSNISNSMSFYNEDTDSKISKFASSGKSPDLGIWSDYHFSSLEREGHNLRTFKSLVTPTEVHNGRLSSLCSEPSHSSLIADNETLRSDYKQLSEELYSTKGSLNKALSQLRNVNQRKDSIERAIYKELSKTRDVLKKTKGNLKQMSLSSANASFHHS